MRTLLTLAAADAGPAQRTYNDLVTATATRQRSGAAPELRSRMRVQVGERRAMGPGKADLLDAIGRSGSLVEAARELGMSYMRAWRLVREMNDSFQRPLVELRRGAHGGAQVTADGRVVLALYRDMERAARHATAAVWRKLRRRLR